jgi:hypothetical protein
MVDKGFSGDQNTAWGCASGCLSGQRGFCIQFTLASARMQEDAGLKNAGGVEDSSIDEVDYWTEF